MNTNKYVDFEINDSLIGMKYNIDKFWAKLLKCRLTDNNFSLRNSAN